MTAQTPRPRSFLLFPSAPYAAAVRPLARETTLSFLERLAGRWHTSATDLIAEFFATRNRPTMSSLKPGGEVYFNADARARFAALSRVPPEHLHRALPAWSRLEPQGHHDAGPAATFYSIGSLAPTAAACVNCTAARTGRAEPARLYTAVHQHICARHQLWLPDTRQTGPGSAIGWVSLTGLPEVVRAHQRHAVLLRRRHDAADAYPVAQAVITAWWDADRFQESLWPQRLERLHTANRRLPLPRPVVRDVVTYPETVTLAGLLASPHWQQQVRADAGKHRPHSPTDVPAFTGELARRLHRPWLAEALAQDASGPLVTWLRSCWHSHAGQRERTRNMWWVAPAYRASAVPAADTGPQPGSLTGNTAHGKSSAKEGSNGVVEGFARGFALAREFAAEQGHLCIPHRYERNGFKLGLWLANQRAMGPSLPPERIRALAALDPGWNLPGGGRWQRNYLKARRLTEAGTRISPETGFPGTSENLGTWLYRQCQRYEGLHPQQQNLLAAIGITADRARRARRRLRSAEEIRAEALDHAHGYFRRHGHLCARSTDTHAGFPIGQWLSNLRVRARRGQLDPALTQHLAALDPWWAAPWPSDWQRACYAVRDLVCSGHILDPESAFTAFNDALGQWLYAQCVTYPDLAGEQRRQLAAVGLTEQAAATARPTPATDHPSLETGLHYARSYAALHGDLNASFPEQHEGFRIGAWLARQRRQANLHTAKFASPYPADPLLEALDLWWNPPWDADWQTNHRAARRLIEDGLALLPAQGFPGTPDWTGQWLYTQCIAYPHLHPGQQHRLTRLGITAAHVSTAQPRRITQQASFDTGLGHARSHAAQHGHLAVPTSARHDGYRLGTWLATQRQRATGGQLPRTRADALTAIDPWWNPPWGMPWQITHHTIRNQIRGHALHAAAGFPGLPPGATRWLLTQCLTYDDLHPGQQRLLTDLGITAEDAHTARPQHEARPRPHPGADRPRPTTVSSSIDAGLPYARSYAALHGGLGTAHYDVEHNGFPLGWWLYEQRKRARAHHRRTGHPWPHHHALATLDPWWNPPWRISWQHTYTTLHATLTAGQPPSTGQRRWLATQHAHWHRLHPDQHTLLTTLEPTPTSPSAAQPT